MDPAGVMDHPAAGCARHCGRIQSMVQVQQTLVSGSWVPPASSST